MTMSSHMREPVYPKSHVGFDSITTQIERKLLKRGFQFNVICVGMFHLSGFPVQELTVLPRANRPGQIHTHQHHLRLSSTQLEGPYDA